jgi:ribosomal protein L11 methylase PrmA
MGASRNPGSFRDPSGHVFERDGRIFRTVAASAADGFKAVRATGILDRLVADGKLVAYWDVAPGEVGIDAAHVLEHPRLDFLSHPYEWPFEVLRAAALFHLDLHLTLMASGATLSDASAYNVQFNGVAPIFIDHLSIRPYRPGEYWWGHRQFCEQFLNPLLLRALFGLPHNAWYRGALEGIPVTDIAGLLGFKHKLSWRVMAHVVLQDRFQRAAARSDRPVTRSLGRSLRPEAFTSMLRQLRTWIARLKPADRGATTWVDYASANAYAPGEEAAKKEFIASAVAYASPQRVIDLGCNTGLYSSVAISAGARSVIGYDYDHQALDRAYLAAAASPAMRAFLPLHLDAANPSPDQGWRQRERAGFTARARADCVFALAFVHHLAIARNLPLPEVVDWIVDIAPVGVIEFVPKHDATVQKMLALRDDIFEQYDESHFVTALTKRARIVRRSDVTQGKRALFLYDRR